jgi:hypothetical protein
MSEDEEDGGHAGWTLVQLAELVQRVEELLLDGITIAGPHAHAGIGPGATLELDAMDVQRIAAVLGEGVEIAEQLALLAATLPDGPIEADYDDVRDAAAAELAAGIGDVRRLVVAARVLDVAHGWPALAAALSGSDAAAAWEELTVEGLLCRFRGADRGVVRQVADEAGLTPSTCFAACPPERLVALAAGLRRHASGHPAA